MSLTVIWPKSFPNPEPIEAESIDKDHSKGNSRDRRHWRCSRFPLPTTGLFKHKSSSCVTVRYQLDGNGIPADKPVLKSARRTIKIEIRSVNFLR